MRITAIVQASIKNLPKNFANFPERYVKKQTQFIQWETPKLPQYQRRTVRYRKQAYYDMFSPWQQEFQRHNGPGVQQPKIYVEPFKYFPVFKGDLVEVLSGKDKGKQGIVCLTIKERNWVCVDKLNVGHSVQNRTYENPGFVYSEALPLLYNRDVLLVDPSDKKPTTIEWRYDEEGNDVRVSKRSGRIIPLPVEAEETYDFKIQSYYTEKAKDTSADEVKKVTFVPEAKTFEMDIMDQMGIEENRVPYDMYWY